MIDAFTFLSSTRGIVSEYVVGRRCILVARVCTILYCKGHCCVLVTHVCVANASVCLRNCTCSGHHTTRAQSHSWVWCHKDKATQIIRADTQFSSFSKSSLLKTRFFTDDARGHGNCTRVSSSHEYVRPHLYGAHTEVLFPPSPVHLSTSSSSARLLHKR